MSYMPTDEEVRLIQQKYKNVYVIIEIYKDMACTSLLSIINGNLISDSLNVDSESIQRRTYSCNLVVDNQFMPSGETNNPRDTINHFKISPDSYIQIDRFIKVYYGIKANRPLNASDYENNNRVKVDGNILYWLVGSFTLVSPNYSYSATDRVLSLSCADFMCEFDGTKNGQITGEYVVGALETEEQLRLNMSYNFKICAVAEYATNADGSYQTNSDGTRIVKSRMKMKDAILATLFMAGIATEKEYNDSVYETDRYSVTGYDYEDYKYVPADMEFEPGQTYTDVWTKLAELYSNYEYYFDITGKFIWREIPTCKDDNVSLTNNQIDPLLISEEHQNSFQGIYNCTEVQGKSFELSISDRYVNTSTYADGTYTITVPLVQPVNVPTVQKDNIQYWFEDGDKVAFMVNEKNDTDSTKVILKGMVDDKLVETWTIPVYDTLGNDISRGSILKDKVWIFVFHKYYEAWDNSKKAYNKRTNCFVLSGSTQAYGYYEETNKDCPYSVPNLGYRIPQRVVFETDFSDSDCTWRAERMTYEACAMKDTVTLNTIIIPWLDVNDKISYVSQFDVDRDKLLAGVIGDRPQYIVKSLSQSTLDGTMSLNAYRFREDFQQVWDREHQAESTTS